MTTIDTSTEAVGALFEALLDDAHDDYSLVKNELVVIQLDRIAAARDLVPALLKERDEARARAAAAFEMAADLADTKFSCSGTDAAHIIRDAIRALPTNQERDALAKVRAEALREAVAFAWTFDGGDKETRISVLSAILNRADQIEKGEM